MTAHNQEIGKKGEYEASKYLQKNNYTIIEKNYRSRWGEIDIIATKASKLIFVEVKTRLNDNFGKPYESFNFNKKSKLRRPVQYFLLKNDYKNYRLSLDVISITFNEDFSIKNLKHFENAGTY